MPAFAVELVARRIRAVTWPFPENGWNTKYVAELFVAVLLYWYALFDTTKFPAAPSIEVVLNSPKFVEIGCAELAKAVSIPQITRLRPVQPEAKVQG